MPQIRTIQSSGSIPTINQLPLGDIALNTYDGKAYIKKAVANTQTIIELGVGSGVTQIVAGTNVTISPVGGIGVVTINSTTGSGTPQTDQITHYSIITEVYLAVVGILLY